MNILILSIYIGGSIMPYNVRELLARIIKCEAGGEGENGMKAVGAVVMNRVNVPAGEYLRVGQGDLRKVIFQPGQFDCVSTILGGQINNQNIYNVTPEQIHYDIADWALSGHKLWGIENALWYFNPYNPECPGIFPANGSGSVINRIGEHCFYIPTELYYET
jgi:N-acetylmuramoyl-L-alanine amidase